MEIREESEFADYIEIQSTKTKPSPYQVSSWVRRFGNSASVALLDPSCGIYSAPHLDGVIGYRIKAGCAVVFGDPVCSKDHLPELVNSFHCFCQERGASVVYTATSSTFAAWAHEVFKGSHIEVAEELLLNPQHDFLESSKGRRLRSKLSHPMKLGIEIQEYLSSDPEIQRAIEAVATDWLSGRQGPQIYLAHVDLFGCPEGKRWFYAKLGDKVIGLLMLNRLEAKEGWVLNLCMATGEAPSGTSELLVLSVLRQLKAEGCSLLTLGVVPRDTLGEIEGFGAMSSWCARKAYLGAKRYFNLERRKEYWRKFHPQSERAYVVFPQAKMSVRYVFGVIQALNAST